MPAPAPVPVLTDGGLRLRAHRPGDVPRVVEQVNDPDSVRWTTAPLPYGPDQAREYLAELAARHAQRRVLAWAVEVEGRFAGTVDVRLDGGGVAEIGYGLHPDARGRGIATRAVRLALGHLLAGEIDTVCWSAAVGNLASRRVAWACGIRVEGVRRGALRTGDGARHDLWVGSVRAGDELAPAHPWWDPVVLTGPRVRLRPWSEADAGVPLGLDEAGRRYAGTMAPGPEGHDAWLVARRARMAAGEGVFWAVADRATDEPLGHVQLTRLDVASLRGTGLLAMWLGAPARGRGLMQEALGLLRAHAFAPRTDPNGRSGLGLHRLAAGAQTGNLASRRALERAGFAVTGVEHRALRTPDGGLADTVSFELLAP